MTHTLAAIVAVLCAPALAQAQVSFDEARKDESKRLAYLAGHLDKLVTKDKAAKVGISGWYYLPNAEHKQKATDALKAAYQKDGRQFFFQRELPGLLAPLESPALRVLPYYREDDTAGSQTKAGILLVENLFGLAGEDEVRSLLEDYAGTVIDIRENSLKTEDRELDANIPALKMVSHTSLIRLWGLSIQLEKILKGERKVSDPFKAEIQKQYLATLKAFVLQLRKEHKIFDDNNENTLQKEIIDYLDFVFDFMKKRFAAAGYEHKPLDKEKIPSDYALEKKG
jgi:hypothetical protein